LPILSYISLPWQQDVSLRVDVLSLQARREEQSTWEV